jgi:hypothetical protein
MARSVRIRTSAAPHHSGGAFGEILRMRIRTKKIVFWSGIAIAAYFVLYFCSVQAVTHKARGPVTPEPEYFPSDVDFLRAAFAPAHFIDVTILRRSYWAPL